MQKERILAASSDVQRAEQEQRRQDDSHATEQVARGQGPDNSPPPTLEEAREALRAAQQPIDETEVEVEGWESKGRWIFYLDLSTDFFKLVVYISFFFIILIFYGIPIHIFRDVFMTGRSFYHRLRDFFKYRTATRDMNNRYPDATAQELAREDVCIICREQMQPYEPQQNGQPNPVAERMRPKKLPCGHILHFSCLRSWLERQQICPTCRQDVLPTQQAARAGTGTQAGGAREAAGQAHPGGNRQGARVFQLGPLRIGVGAARGNNMFEEIQQQLGDGRAGPLPPANPNGPQQYGFGIRWDAGNRRRPRRLQPATVREQLDLVERQVQQDIQTLGQDLREFGALRQMQLELDRIRSQRAGAPQPQLSQQPAVPQFPISGVARGPPITTLSSNDNGTVLQAGSDQLPQGLTLPEGWTMMPLHSAALPPPPQIPGMRTFRPPAMPQQIWTPGMHFPIQVPPGATMHDLPTLAYEGQHLQNVRPTGLGPQQQPSSQGTNQPQLNGVHSSSASQPMVDAASNTNNLGLQTAAQLHEQYLASLQTPQQDQETNGSANNTARSPTTRTSSVAPNGPTTEIQETASVVPEPQVRNPPLPSWGWSPTIRSQDNDGEAGIEVSDTNGSTGAENSGAQSTGHKRKSPSATVEDLVEDPD